MMRLILIVLCCLLFASCDKGVPTSNPAYSVKYLFTYDSVKVYRFMDADHYQYFSVHLRK